MFVFGLHNLISKDYYARQMSFGKFVTSIHLSTGNVETKLLRLFYHN